MIVVLSGTRCDWVSKHLPPSINPQINENKANIFKINLIGSQQIITMELYVFLININNTKITGIPETEYIGVKKDKSCA